MPNHLLKWNHTGDSSPKPYFYNFFNQKIFNACEKLYRAALNRKITEGSSIKEPEPVTFIHPCQHFILQLLHLVIVSRKPLLSNVLKEIFGKNL